MELGFYQRHCGAVVTVMCQDTEVQDILNIWVNSLWVNSFGLGINGINGFYFLDGMVFP